MMSISLISTASPEEALIGVPVDAASRHLIVCSSKHIDV
jgi:hypothetical protein